MCLYSRKQLKTQEEIEKKEIIFLDKKNNILAIQTTTKNGPFKLKNVEFLQKKQKLKIVDTKIISEIYD